MREVREEADCLRERNIQKLLKKYILHNAYYEEAKYYYTYIISEVLQIFNLIQREEEITYVWRENIFLKWKWPYKYLSLLEEGGWRRSWRELQREIWLSISVKI